MKIAIIGNRKGWTYEFVRKTLKDQGVTKDDIIISGGAYGVDTFAQQYAKEIGAIIKIHYPDPTVASPQRYYQRNYNVVSDGDKVIAFNKNNNPRSGTANALNYAKKISKPYVVIS